MIERLAAENIQIDAAQHLVLAEPLRQPADVDERLRPWDERKHAARAGSKPAPQNNFGELALLGIAHDQETPCRRPPTARRPSSRFGRKPGWSTRRQIAADILAAENHQMDDAVLAVVEADERAAFAIDDQFAAADAFDVLPTRAAGSPGRAACGISDVAIST